MFGEAKPNNNLTENNHSKSDYNSLFFKGKKQVIIGNYELAIATLQKAEQLAQKSKNKKATVLILLEFGKAYQFNAEHAKAIRLYETAYKLYEKNKASNEFLRVLTSLIDYYRSIGNWEKAYKYMNEALRLSKRVKMNAEVEIRLYNRIAAVENERMRPEKSFAYSQHALQLAEKNKLDYLSAVSLNEIGFYFENKREYEKALNFYFKAQGYWKDEEALRDYTNVTENIARVYRKQGKIKKSNVYAFEAMLLAEKNQWFANLQSIYLLLEGNFYLLNDMEKSNLYKARSLDAQISTYKKENSREVKELIEKYETEKKDKEIENQRAVNELISFKLYNEQKEKKWLIIGLSFLLGLLIIIAYLLRKQTELVAELKRKTNELQLSNMELTASLKHSSILMQEVHHRVKNNLQLISSMIEMEMLSKGDGQESQVLGDINRRVGAMSMVHQLLYSNHQLDKIEVHAYFELIIKEINTLSNTFILHPKINLTTDEIWMEMNQCVYLGMILSELVSNSLKHAFRGILDPEISVLLKENDDGSIHLYYSDNGNGMGQNTKSPTGLGTRLIEIFSRQIKGQQKVIYAPNYQFELVFSLQK